MFAKKFPLCDRVSGDGASSGGGISNSKAKAIQNSYVNLEEKFEKVKRNHEILKEAVKLYFGRG